MRICNEIAQQIIELGGRDDAMTVFLQPWAWEELQEENLPHLNAQATPPTIFGLPIRITTEALMEVQVTLEPKSRGEPFVPCVLSPTVRMILSGPKIAWSSRQNWLPLYTNCREEVFSET
jgi:hypothetical protein